MAFPVVQQVVENSTPTAGTSHVINLPTATAGQLLLIILDKGSTAASVNAHASLTELLDEALANGLYIAYRWMDGTEPASYTLTTSASTRSASMAYRISGAENPATQAPQIGTTATGTSATPDPPAVTPTGGAKDYLWIPFVGMAGEEADDDTWSNTPPTSYTPSPPRQKACGIAGANLGGLITSAERALNASTENPGTFNVDVSAAWRAQTVVIYPAAVADADAEVAWSELEVPLASARADISWSELEVPTADARADVAWSEFEVPAAPADAEIAWAELQISDPDADAEVSWTELEVPTADSSAHVAWTELEVPTASARADVAFTELETPFASARADVSWAELEVPELGGGEPFDHVHQECPTLISIGVI